MGINIKKFMPVKPPYISGNNNFRGHRKDIIIDGKVAFTGGINLDEAYINLSLKFGAFRDMQFKIKGSAVKAIENIFIDNWYMSTKYKENLQTIIEEVNIEKEHKINKNYKNSIQVINNYPTYIDSINLNTFVDAINSAKKTILLETPYFIPPQELSDALIKAAVERNVKIKLLVPGITDKMFVLDVTRVKYEKLRKHGIEVYETNNIFNHTKLAIFDSQLTIVGTCNLDYRSFFPDQQTTVVLSDKIAAKKLTKIFERDLLVSHKIVKNPIKYKGIIQRVVIKIMVLFSPLL